MNVRKKIKIRNKRTTTMEKEREKQKKKTVKANLHAQDRTTYSFLLLSRLTAPNRLNACVCAWVP